MNFCKILNDYIDKIGCTSKELSDVTNISQAVISRYRSGDRTPNYDSDKYDSLISGLEILAKEKSIESKNIKSDFDKIFINNNINFERFNSNFNLLVNELKINMADISRYIGFDSSYLSKIKSGTRRPKNTNEFINGICKYIIKYYNDDNSKEIISELINCEIDDISDNEKYFEKLSTWISNNKVVGGNSIDNFLKKLDDFDLNEYIKVIKFDNIKVPTLPYSLPKSKTYYGIKGSKDAQLDALKRTVLSKNMDDVFLYSNMPMQEIAKDTEFGKKWMFGLALMLKKGLHLNVIHDLNRPFKEMMLGLESWIPLYMTGQISPYYFKNANNSIYSTLNCISGSIALSGECITGHYNKSKFYLTNKKDEVSYYKEKAKLLIKKASPLMEIYKEENKKDFSKFITNNISVIGDRRNILYSIPIYTISDDLLNKILDKNDINDTDKKLIKNFVLKEKNQVEEILKNNNIIDEINILSKDEFENNNVCLSISKSFYDKKILYTYEDYLEHIKLLKDYKKLHNNYNYKTDNKNIFKNINISIIKDKQVIISKENAPIIHFVIHHPKLVSSIEKFEVPVIEKY